MAFSPTQRKAFKQHLIALHKDPAPLNELKRVVNSESTNSVELSEISRNLHLQDMVGVTPGASDADIANAYRDFHSELTRERNGRMGATAQQLTRLLQEWESGYPNLNPGTAKFWNAYFDTADKLEELSIDEFISSVEQQAGGIGILRESLATFAENSNVPASSLPKIINELGRRGVRTVDPISRQTFDAIHKAGGNLVRIAAPEKATTALPAFSLQSRQAVSKAGRERGVVYAYLIDATDLDDAMSYFDRFGSKMADAKKAASEISTELDEGHTVESVFIAYFLQLIEQQRSKMTAQALTKRLAETGLLEEDVQALTGTGGGGKINYEAAARTVLEKTAEDADRMYFGPLIQAVESKKLVLASKLSAQIAEAKVQAQSSWGNEVLANISNHIEEYAALREKFSNLYKSEVFASYYTGSKLYNEYCQDDDRFNEIFVEHKIKVLDSTGRFALDPLNDLLITRTYDFTGAESRLLNVGKIFLGLSIVGSIVDLFTDNLVTFSEYLVSSVFWALAIGIPAFYYIPKLVFQPEKLKVTKYAFLGAIAFMAIMSLASGFEVNPVVPIAGLIVFIKANNDRSSIENEQAKRLWNDAVVKAEEDGWKTEAKESGVYRILSVENTAAVRATVVLEPLFAGFKSPQTMTVTTELGEFDPETFEPGDLLSIDSKQHILERVPRLAAEAAMQLDNLAKHLADNKGYEAAVITRNLDHHFC